MKKWVVKFDDIKTIDTLKNMGLISHLPLFYSELKFVFIETDMSLDEILDIKGVKSAREESVGTIYV